MVSYPIVRYRAVPNPDGCRWCGDDRYHHGHQYVRSVGMHTWVEPTREQRLARIKARRNNRTPKESDA